MNNPNKSPYIYEFDPLGDSTAAKVVQAVGKRKSVLELGCAYGVMTKVMVEHAQCRVFGLEFDAESAQHAKPYCENLEILDVENANWDQLFGEKRFEVIVAADVLEHLRDPLSCLIKLKKFLTVDGYFVLSIPNVAHNGVIAELMNNDFGYKPTGLLDATHLRFFGAQSIKRLLDHAGLVVNNVEATKIKAENTEFSSAWSSLPEWLSGVLSLRPEGDVYQYVIKASCEGDFLSKATWDTQLGFTSFNVIEQRIKDAEKRTEELTEAAEAAEKRVAELEAILLIQTSSISWKITKPLRFLMRLFRFGLLREDKQALVDTYHKLPIPISLKRAISFIKHKVISKTFSRIKRLFFKPIKFSPPVIRPISQADNPDYIVWGVIDWHFRFQRPQQLSTAIAANGRRVFYISPNFIDDERAGFDVEPLNQSLNLFQVKLYVKGSPSIYSNAPTIEELNQLAKSIGELLNWAQSNQIISLVEHPFWCDVASLLPNSRLVYDCMDHHEGFGNNADSLMKLEKKLFKNSELVITTSSWLDEQVVPFAKSRELIRNAGDYGHFSKLPSSVYKDVNGRKVIGYYGAIAEWFDLDLVEAVAKKYSDCCVLLVGADSVNAKSRLSKLTNIIFVGEVSYAELPYYLYGFDVCLLPFKVIPLTLATNPVKAYEFLSAGKPIITVDLPEMSQFKSIVYIEKDKESFVDCVGNVLNQQEPQSLIAERKKFAEGQTWAHRTKELITHSESTERDPKVSVIVLTYNNLDLTKACLSSLVEFSQYDNIEIIVVDNASTDGSPEFLSEWASKDARRKLILNQENLGFAAGNNIGLAAATGDYLVILNNDTFVTAGWIRTLVNHCKRDGKIGLIGPVTNNIGNEAKITIEYQTMSEMALKAKDYTNWNIGGLLELRTLAFFCVMMPRATYKLIGGLDENYGLGFFEDDDYCRRVEKNGLRIACAEDVFVHHHLSASFNKLKVEHKQQLFEKNKKTYEDKWGKWIPHTYRSKSSNGPKKPQEVVVDLPHISSGKEHIDGVCNICGNETKFFYTDKSLWRESLNCNYCLSTSRYRSIARGLLLAINQLVLIDAKTLSSLPKSCDKRLKVYDTQTPFYYHTCSYPLPDLLKATGWIDVELSNFKPKKPLGATLSKGVTNQNLECLTFQDETLDIIVTSDVMEHVRLDDLAHREIFRVLKPGGYYIFTVPHDRSWGETLTRVKILDPNDSSKDVHLLEPEYHGDTNSDEGGGVLAYRTYGRDIEDNLRNLGFEVNYSRDDIPNFGILNSELYFCKKSAR